MGDHRREPDRRDERAWKRRRDDPMACHNCGERGHLAKDCLSTHGKEIKDKVLVKDRRVKPRVIGTGGGVIKGLEQELGVRLKVEDVVRDDPDQGFYVRISGPGLDEVCRAVTRLEKLVAEVEAEQRAFEERRTLYQQQSGVSPNSPPKPAPQPLGVALDAVVQASAGTPRIQPFQSGGFVPQRFVGGPAQRSSGLTSLRREYEAAMRQPQGVAAAGVGQGPGVYDHGITNFNQGGGPNSVQGGVLSQGANFAYYNQSLPFDQKSGYGQGMAPDQGLASSQGGASEHRVNGGQGPKQMQGVKPGERNDDEQTGTALEQNMEMSPDRKDAFPAASPPVATGNVQSPANYGSRSVSPSYPGGAFGGVLMNGPGLGGGGIQAGPFTNAHVYMEPGVQSRLGVRTLDELETRNIAEYLDLAKQQMFEEDEEINRHRQRMREIQDYFQLRLSTLRQKQSQQREEFLILETQQRPQLQLQPVQIALAKNGSAIAHQGLGNAQGVTLAGQYG